MIRYLEVGPERNRHSRGTRYSKEWTTMGISSKNRDLDIESNMNDRWPFDDCLFKIVFASHVLEHAKNPIHWVSEAFRVLEPGGTIRVNVPNAKWLCQRYMDKKKSLFQLARNLRSWHGAGEFNAHWHPYDKMTLEALLKYSFYPMLGIEPTEQSLDEEATFFFNVEICDPMKSREDMMRDQKYFSSRYDRTIYGEGTKP